MTPDELRRHAEYVKTSAHNPNVPFNKTLGYAVELVCDAAELMAETAEQLQPTEREKAARESELYWAMRAVEEAGASPELTAVGVKLADRLRLLRGS